MGPPIAWRRRVRQLHAGRARALGEGLEDRRDPAGV